MGALGLSACGTPAIVRTGPVNKADNACGYPSYTKSVTLTWWTWIPNSSKVAAVFEKCYPSVHIKTPLVPASTGEYSKLEAATTAGAGAPDVVQIEYQELPTFIGQHDLANIASVAGRYRKDYPTWLWDEVSSGRLVYAVPQDIGPEALAYRPALLAKYGISVPVTYSQFAVAAKDFHKKDPSRYMTYFPDNDGGYVVGLLWQAGAQPFKQTGKYSWKVNIDSAIDRKVLEYWYSLVRAGAVELIDDYTPAWEAQMAKGEFASYFIAAWSPTSEVNEYIKTGSQHFKVTHLPEWARGKVTDANWGGSSDAVTTQSKHPRAAALFATFMNTAPRSLQVLEKSGANGGAGLFPGVNSRAKAPTFDSSIPNFAGKVNADFASYTPHVNTSFEWSPFTEYFYTELEGQLANAFSGKESIAAALSATQASVISYGNASGYNVTAVGDPPHHLEGRNAK